MEKKILRHRNSVGWMDALVDGHLCQAKVYDEPSVFGINGGRVSKLSISEGPEWNGFNHVIYNYDRGLDFDNSPPGLVDEVVAFLEASI